ncbi:MAG: hypothetical protein ACLFQ6_03290, partial [Candidatus Sumerlaeia bacterium]
GILPAKIDSDTIANTDVAPFSAILHPLPPGMVAIRRWRPRVSGLYSIALFSDRIYMVLLALLSPAAA